MPTKTRERYKRDREGKFARANLPQGVRPKSDLGKAILMARKSTSLRIKAYRMSKAGKPKEDVARIKSLKAVLDKKVKEINKRLIKESGHYVDAGGNLRIKASKGKPKVERPKEKPSPPKSKGKPIGEMGDFEAQLYALKKFQDLTVQPKTGLGSRQSLAEWDNCKNLKEATEMITRKFGVEANLKYLNTESVTEAMKQIEVMIGCHPEILKGDEFRRVSSRQSDLPGLPKSAIAAVYPMVKGNSGNNFWGVLALKPKYYKDRSRLTETVERCKNSGFHVKADAGPEKIMTHEFGHLYHNFNKHNMFAVMDGGLVDIRDPLTEWAEKTQEALIGPLSSSPQWTVSDYAKANEKETLAETFTAVHHGNFDSRPARQLRVLLGFLSDYSEPLNRKPSKADYDKMMKVVYSTP